MVVNVMIWLMYGGGVGLFVYGETSSEVVSREEVLNNGVVHYTLKCFLYYVFRVLVRPSLFGMTCSID